MKTKMDIEEIKHDIKKSAVKVEYLELLRSVLLCVAVFLVITNMFVRPVYVEGDSMYPTFKDQEFGVTNVIGNTLGSLKRFDIVMVNSKSEDKYIVKRVIGLPGEIVQYRDNVLYINGEVKDEYFLNQTYVKESTNNGKIHFTEDFGPVKLKADEYFLCGDNRQISRDSRNVGPFNQADIISKDLFIILH